MSQKSLVVYFSCSGVTKKTAELLSDVAGADLFEIRPEVPYTKADLDWMDKKSRSTVEMNDPSSRPAIADKVEHMEQYDTVYVGFPIWWYREPMVIRTFLSRYQWKGKTIIPFCTSLEVDIPQARSDIMKLAPGAAVLEGRRFATENANLASEVKSWVQGLHI